MNTEVIEGEARELEEPRALAVRQPDHALTISAGPKDMIAVATNLANALKDIVDKRKLYANISGRKFPTVEAWMTIGRMDNVVAREAEPPLRRDDGSYEAFVELIRLSDGMVIGRASALCGTQGDKPWDGRAEPHRRSMAVTRATSRAFRQQYSWIMALAGYEATPAEEMPDDADRDDEAGTETQDGEERLELLGRLGKSGTVRKGGASAYKLEPRVTPDGYAIGFRLEIDGDRDIPQVLAEGQLGAALYFATEGHPERMLGKHAKVKGRLFNVRPAGRRAFYRLVLTEIEALDFTLPAPVPDPAESGDATPEPAAEAESVPLFDADEDAAIDAAVEKAGAA